MSTFFSDRAHASTQITLLECYRFLAPKSDYALIVSRLSHIIRGIGDPMVAVYARMYLARVSSRVITDDPKSIAGALEDYIVTCVQDMVVETFVGACKYRINVVTIVCYYIDALVVAASLKRTKYLLSPAALGSTKMSTGR